MDEVDVRILRSEVGVLHGSRGAWCVVYKARSDKADLRVSSNVKLEVRIDCRRSSFSRHKTDGSARTGRRQI